MLTVVSWQFNLLHKLVCLSWGWVQLFISMLLIDAFLSILNNMMLPKRVCIQYGVVPIAVGASLEREKCDTTELCGPPPRNFMYFFFFYEFNSC